MDKNRLLSRREFLIGLAAALGGAALAGLRRLLGASPTHGDLTPTPRAYLPYLSRGQAIPTTPSPTSTTTPTSTPTLSPTPTATLPPPTKPRVVHVRDADATNWNGGAFYNAVNQDVVNNMVQVGLQQLTEKSDWEAVWNVLFERVHPGGYSPGQKIAIKVNFNNSGRDGNSCTMHNNLIDALPHPVLALIHGLVAAGVRPEDIVIYDATCNVGRIFPSYFRTPITSAHPDVGYIGSELCPGVNAPSYGKDPSLVVHFNDPEGFLGDRFLVDLLYDATYLINVPILKQHGGDDFCPVSLGFKNHLGSIHQVIQGADDDLHRYLYTSDPSYRPTYSPLVEIYTNPNIRNKTVLILGDGLYGAFGAVFEPPYQWNTFGDAPNSLFFAIDPVAVDCVMADFLVAEGQVSRTHTYDYLFCAVEAGLGVCEGTRDAPGGDPWALPYGSGYDDIEYIRLDL